MRVDRSGRGGGRVNCHVSRHQDRVVGEDKAGAHSKGTSGKGTCIQVIGATEGSGRGRGKRRQVQQQECHSRCVSEPSPGARNTPAAATPTTVKLIGRIDTIWSGRSDKQEGGGHHNRGKVRHAMSQTQHDTCSAPALCATQPTPPPRLSQLTKAPLFANDREASERGNSALSNDESTSPGRHRSR